MKPVDDSLLSILDDPANPRPRVVRPPYSLHAVPVIYFTGFAWALLATVPVGIIAWAAFTADTTAAIAIPLWLSIHVGFCISRRPADHGARYAFALFATNLLTNAVILALARVLR